MLDTYDDKNNNKKSSNTPDNGATTRIRPPNSHKGYLLPPCRANTHTGSFPTSAHESLFRAAAIMYRRGPSKATPANVQCQKCLKRDMSPPSPPRARLRQMLTFAARHYTYECKATAQERPYVARPSRTQQLFNPKLVPKLASEIPDPLQDK